MTDFSSRWALWVPGVLLACDGSVTETKSVQVMVAASAEQAVQEVLAGCGDVDGVQTTVAAGSSATLARQIELGAPAHLFLSANTGWMDHLEGAGRIEAASRVALLANRLVVVAPASSTGRDSVVDLVAALGDGRLAVGDPDHVPAGIYARQALEALGQWDALEPRLARGADVRAALAFVERGEVPLGIVYATDAASSSDVVVVAELPSTLHDPIVYPLARVSHAEPLAGVDATWSCLQTEAAAAVFARHGFAQP